MRDRVKALLVVILALQSAGICGQFIPKDYSHKEMKAAKN